MSQIPPPTPDHDTDTTCSTMQLPITKPQETGMLRILIGLAMEVDSRPLDPHQSHFTAQNTKHRWIIRWPTRSPRGVQQHTKYINNASGAGTSKGFNGSCDRIPEDHRTVKVSRKPLCLPTVLQPPSNQKETRGMIPGQPLVQTHRGCLRRCSPRTVSVERGRRGHEVPDAGMQRNERRGSP